MSGTEYRLRWIAELEEEVKAMNPDGWPADAADGARVAAYTLFGDWSPLSDALGKIYELKYWLYGPLSTEVIEAKKNWMAARSNAREHSLQTMAAWNETKVVAAVNSFVEVYKEACK